jgi:hypothetical protein
MIEILARWNGQNGALTFSQPSFYTELAQSQLPGVYLSIQQPVAPWALPFVQGNLR